jgi:ribosomal protein L5
MTLSSLQIFLSKKGRLLTAQKSSAAKKIRKGYHIGSSINLNGIFGKQFLHFLIFSVMPRLDLNTLLLYQKKNLDFKFFIKTSKIVDKLTPFFNFFEYLPPLQVVVFWRENSTERNFFFLRLLKFPVYTTKLNVS